MTDSFVKIFEFGILFLSLAVIVAGAYSIYLF